MDLDGLERRLLADQERVRMPRVEVQGRWFMWRARTVNDDGEHGPWRYGWSSAVAELRAALA